MGYFEEDRFGQGYAAGFDAGYDMVSNAIKPMINDLLKANATRITHLQTGIKYLKRDIGFFYAFADPEQVDGDIWFEKLNKSKDRLRRAKAKLRKLVIAQRVYKDILRG